MTSHRSSLDFNPTKFEYSNSLYSFVVEWSSWENITKIVTWNCQALPSCPEIVNYHSEHTGVSFPIVINNTWSSSTSSTNICSVEYDRNDTATVIYRGDSDPTSTPGIEELKRKPELVRPICMVCYRQCSQLLSEMLGRNLWVAKTLLFSHASNRGHYFSLLPV